MVNHRFDHLGDLLASTTVLGVCGAVGVGLLLTGDAGLIALGGVSGSILGLCLACWPGREPDDE
jgi:hypothetical protein